MGGKTEAIVEELRAWGLTLPGAHRKSPWPDHDDLAVKDKTFAYLPGKGKPFGPRASCPTLATRRSSCPMPSRPATASARAGGSASTRRKTGYPALDSSRRGLRKVIAPRRRASS